MGAPVDAAARERALDPRTSFLVQAPAGSGKTELLTRRVLTLLAEVDEPEEVLAITFTKKAAAEMRQRVVEMLAAAASDDEPADPHAAEGRRLARRALARDRERGWRLLEDAARLNLRTIDSLTGQLVRGLPVVSTLGGAGDVDRSPEPLYAEAARRFIEENLEVSKPLLLHIGNDLDRLQRLLVELLGLREQWRRYLPLGQVPPDELREALEGMLETLVRARLGALVAALPPSAPTALVPLLRTASELLVVASEVNETELSDVQRAIVETGDGLDSMPGDAPEDRTRWGAIAAFLLTNDDTWRKRGDVKLGVPGKGNAKAFGKEAKELEAHSKAYGALLKEVAAHEHGETLCARLAEVRALPAPAYDDDDWVLLVHIVSRLGDLVTELQVVFGERGQVDYPEVTHRAVVALGTDDEPTDLSLSMDLRLRHVLVDEFQDTSRAQWRLFERLVAGWTRDDGRTFFAVGDPMQSIYRFREGEVSLFLAAAERGIGDVSLEPLRLQSNFRSAPGVVGWVNDSFGRIFPSVADPDIGAVPYERSTAHLDGIGEVLLHAVPAGCRAEADEHVVQLVREALMRDEGGTIGILVRSRAHADGPMRAMRAAGIPYRAVEIEALERRPVVIDLVSLAFALRHPHDRLHWIAVLRGPLCGLLLDDLHALLGDDTKVAAIDRLRDGVALAALSSDGRRRLERFAAVVLPAVRHATRDRVVPWVESVWLKLGGPAACEGAADEAAAERCLGRLMELERSGRIWDRRELRGAVDRLFASDDTDGGARVHVMTMHKSKGLEFDTVILPALERQGRGDTKRLIDWYETSIEGAPLLLAPIDASDSPSSVAGPLGALIRDARRQADAQERLRLLYVAATRARTSLHLVATLPAQTSKGEPGKARSNSLLAPLYERFLDDAIAVDAVPPASDEPDEGGQRFELTEVPPFTRSVSDWTFPELERFEWRAPKPRAAIVERIERDWAASTARDVGTVVHRALLNLSLAPPAKRRPPDAADIDRISLELKNLGVPDMRLDEATGQVVEAIRNTLLDKRGKWILDDAHAEARSEWALTVPEHDAEGRFVGVRRVIVDRTFVDADGVRWIVDYKTGSHEGGGLDAFLDAELERYRDQLDGYVDVMGRVDSRPVKVGLWFPMVRGWREFAPTPRTAAAVA